MVAAYMDFVQQNASACVRRAVSRLVDGEARIPMDGGGEIVVRTRVDAEKGEVRVDLTATFNDAAVLGKAQARVRL